MIDYDAMTPAQRAAHRIVAEYIVRTCDGKWVGVEDICQDACENAGSDLETSDELNNEYLRDASRALIEAIAAGAINLDTAAPIIETIVSVLDDDEITSDDADADAHVVCALNAVMK